MLNKNYPGNEFHHYIDWPLVFLSEILISAIKFLQRLLKPQGYIALWQKSINQALVAISEIIIGTAILRSIQHLLRMNSNLVGIQSE